MDNLFDDYEVVPHGEGSDAFQLRHKASGDVLLTTQYASLSTLIRLVLEDEIDISDYVAL